MIPGSLSLIWITTRCGIFDCAGDAFCACAATAVMQSRPSANSTPFMVLDSRRIMFPRLLFIRMDCLVRRCSAMLLFAPSQELLVQALLLRLLLGACRTWGKCRLGARLVEPLLRRREAIQPRHLRIRVHVLPFR